MTAPDYRAEAAGHLEEAVIANQSGKWETARFELKLAEVKAVLALSDPPEVLIEEAPVVKPGPTPADLRIDALSREAFERARAGRS